MNIVTVTGPYSLTYRSNTLTWLFYCPRNGIAKASTLFSDPPLQPPWLPARSARETQGGSPRVILSTQGKLKIQRPSATFQIKFNLNGVNLYSARSPRQQLRLKFRSSRSKSSYSPVALNIATLRKYSVDGYHLRLLTTLYSTPSPRRRSELVN
jgi:hypothetical protein